MNFTNPAGLVTEAIRTSWATAPSGSATRRRGSAAASPRRSGAAPDELWFDYFGLNHLGWLRGVHDGDARPAARSCSPTTSGSPASRRARLFGGEWLRALGMIPNEYLFFYYFASDTVGALRSGLESRGEFLLHQQAAFYGENGRTPEEALEAWRAHAARARGDVLRRGARGRRASKRPDDLGGRRRLRGRGARRRRGDRARTSGAC